MHIYIYISLPPSLSAFTPRMLSDGARTADRGNLNGLRSPGLRSPNHHHRAHDCRCGARCVFPQIRRSNLSRNAEQKSLAEWVGACIGREDSAAKPKVSERSAAFAATPGNSISVFHTMSSSHGTLPLLTDHGHD